VQSQGDFRRAIELDPSTLTFFDYGRAALHDPDLAKSLFGRAAKSPLARGAQNLTATILTGQPQARAQVLRGRNDRSATAALHGRLAIVEQSYATSIRRLCCRAATRQRVSLNAVMECVPVSG
jgi:hypothetical protein